MLNKLCLLWQDVVTRQWFHVANLTKNSTGTYRFSYERNESNKGLRAAIDHGYRLHPTFEDVTKEYVSKKCFSVFDRRLPNLNRRDYQQAYQELGISSTSSVFEVLTLTGGILRSDSYEFVEPITLDADNHYCLNCYLRGWRYYNEDNEPLLDTDILSLKLDEQNKYDENAVCVITCNNKTIGYLPSFYSEFVRNQILDNHLGYELDFKYNEHVPSHYKVRLTIKGQLASEALENVSNKAPLFLLK